MDQGRRIDGTRRDFLATSSMGLGGAWLLTRMPMFEAAVAHGRRAALEGRPFAALTEEEAREIEAIAARIIPTDETPGAREAGVIRFIDRALETFMAAQLPVVREGVADLATRVAAESSDVSAFSALPEPRQDEILGEIEAGEFFEMTRFLTVMGMFSDPEHGGNRDKVGWQLLGFEDRYRWVPPFGYYDEEANRG